jgi:hypothetical protein
MQRVQSRWHKKAQHVRVWHGACTSSMHRNNLRSLKVEVVYEIPKNDSSSTDADGIGCGAAAGKASLRTTGRGSKFVRRYIGCVPAGSGGVQCACDSPCRDERDGGHSIFLGRAGNGSWRVDAPGCELDLGFNGRHRVDRAAGHRGIGARKPSADLESRGFKCIPEWSDGELRSSTRTQKRSPGVTIKLCSRSFFVGALRLARICE